MHQIVKYNINNFNVETLESRTYGNADSLVFKRQQKKGSSRFNSTFFLLKYFILRVCYEIIPTFIVN